MSEKQEGVFQTNIESFLMKCIKCMENKEVSEFAWRNKTNGLKKKQCKQCESEYHKLYYSKNKPKYIVNGKKNVVKYRQRNMEYVYEYLTAHPCVDCGNTNPIVLEFDHLNDKKFNISDMIREARSCSSIQKEIEKCVVRCANCHRIKTAMQNNWKMWRYMLNL